MKARVPSTHGVVDRHLVVLLIGLVSSGCATSIKEMPHHPAQERLDRILATILPHTSHPDLHYWVRVSEPTEHPVGLAVLPQRHIYLSEPIVEQADETILTTLLTHGVAHHRLHHHGQRSILNVLQRIAFKVGGFFVPGLSHGHHIGGPLAEVALSGGQEPAADAKTITYLTRMGYSEQELRLALEFLAEHGYGERVGRVSVRGREFTNRIAKLR